MVNFTYWSANVDGVFVVNFTYWRAGFKVAILFCDFSLGSKSDILGSFGTFPARIEGFSRELVSTSF